MSSLTKTAFFTKKFIITFLIVAVLAISYFVLRPTGKKIWETIFPPPGEPALVAFGKLPELELAAGIKPPVNVVYKIETVTGNLKELEKQLKVFEIKEPIAAFGDLGKANKIAETFQFLTPPALVEGGKAHYFHRNDPDKTLTIELTTGNSTLESNYLNKQDVLTAMPKNEKDSKQLANHFMENFALESKGFPDKNITFVKYRIENGKLTEAVSLSAANLMQVNYNRADIDKVPVVSELYDKPKVMVLVSAEDIVAANFSVVNIEKYKFSTYPLKGVKKAFDDLKNGKAIYNKELKEDTFAIRDIGLGYLEVSRDVPYLQPVYIFKSDEGLAAYVPAVSDEYLITKAPVNIN